MERTALQAKKAAAAAIAKVRPIVGLRTVSLQEPAAMPTLKKYTPSQLHWMRCLFRLADYAAGDARRGSAGSPSGNSVNYDRGSAIAEYGVFVRTLGTVGRNDGGGSGPF